MDDRRPAHESRVHGDDHNSSLRNAAMNLVQGGNVDLEEFAKKYYEAEDKGKDRASKSAGGSSAK